MNIYKKLISLLLIFFSSANTVVASDTPSNGIQSFIKNCTVFTAIAAGCATCSSAYNWIEKKYENHKKARAFAGMLKQRKDYYQQEKQAFLLKLKQEDDLRRGLEKIEVNYYLERLNYKDFIAHTNRTRFHIMNYYTNRETPSDPSIPSFNDVDNLAHISETEYYAFSQPRLSNFQHNTLGHAILSVSREINQWPTESRIFFDAARAHYRFNTNLEQGAQDIIHFLSRVESLGTAQRGAQELQRQRQIASASNRLSRTAPIA